MGASSSTLAQGEDPLIHEFWRMLGRLSLDDEVQPASSTRLPCGDEIAVSHAEWQRDSDEQIEGVIATSEKEGAKALEEVAQAVERFRVLDESDDVPPITNGNMGASSSAGKGDQTPTEEKKAVWDNNEPIRTTTPPPPPLATTPPPPPRHKNQRRTSVLDGTTFPLPPGRDQFLAIAARPPPPCPAREEIRRKRQGGIYHFVAPALSSSASSDDRAAALSLPPGAADADAARSAGLWTPRPTIPDDDAARPVGLWTPPPDAAPPKAGPWTPVTARSAMVGAALSALTSAAPPAPPCPSFPPPAPPCPSFAPPPPPPSSWTTISPPASSAPAPRPRPTTTTLVRPSSSVYSGDVGPPASSVYSDDGDDNDDDDRPIMATYPAFAAPVLPLVVTRDTALFSNPVMMISGGVARPARAPPVGRRRISEEVEAEERERRRVGRVRMGLRRVGGVVKGFFERK